jgi:DNA polymerase III subunit delta'
MLLREVVGHKEVKERFVAGAKEGRVSHALLISGMEGTGGLPLALAFAQFLTCEKLNAKTEDSLFGGEERTDPLDDSCGKCPSCLKNQKMVHPDVHYSFPVVTQAGKESKSIEFTEEFRAAVLQHPYLDLNDWFEYLGVENKQGFISVDESADILRKLQLKSFESEYKIIIQWMPEKMRTEAANKLLKILEEPPEKTIFFLVTENRDQLLPTILSRTQLIKAGRLMDEEMVEALTAKGISAQEAKRIVHLADGNYHHALTLATSEMPEKSSEELFLEWMRLCFAPMKSLPKLYQWIDALAKSGRENQKQFLLSCIQIVRECMMVNVGPEEVVRLDEKQSDTLKNFFPFIHESNIYTVIHDLNEAIYHIERNANPKILFLDLSFRLNQLLKKA